MALKLSMRSILSIIVFLFFSYSTYGRSIFGTYQIRQGQCDLGRSCDRIAEDFVNKIDTNRFSPSYEGYESVQKSDVVDGMTINEYLDGFKRESVAGSRVDLYFSFSVQNSDKGLKKLGFFIENKNGQTIFNRESVYDYDKTSEYSTRLKKWLDEFAAIMPPVAKITKVEEGKISLKIIHGNTKQQLKGRPFYVGVFDYSTNLFGDDYTEMGTVTNVSGSFGDAYVYKEFAENNFKVGDQVIILRGNQNIDKSREKVIVSETWFNYLNLPKYSLLNCAMLPVVSNMKNGEKLHEQLVEMVTDYKLCKFRNSEKLNKILDKYKDNYEGYLNNETVLQLISKKLEVGALFRTKVYQVLNGVSIKFDVVSENGKNIYYSKYMIIENYDTDYITELVYGWILDYKNSLPLSGRIIQIRDKNLLIDIPAGLVDGSEHEFKVIRPISLRYEEVLGNRKVKWNTETIAYGAINRIEKYHSIGNIFKYANKNTKVKEGDWILIEGLEYNIKKDDLLYNKHNLKSKRNIGSGRVTTEITNIKAGGKSESIYGFGVALDFYLPYGLIFTGESVRNLSGSDSSISNNNFMFSLGYSFTPRLYEYLSLVDVYIGKKIVNYDISSMGAFGIGDLKYSGFFLGATGEVPIYKSFSLLGTFNFSPSDSVENTDKVFGDVASSKSFALKLSGKYQFDNGHALIVNYSKMKFKSTYDGVDGVESTLNSDLIKISYGIDF